MALILAEKALVMVVVDIMGNMTLESKMCGNSPDSELLL
jgi:hypothetical protein